MLLKAGIGNEEWENEMENWIWEINFFNFFCFRFTVYNEEQIFCSGNRTEWSPIRSVTTTKQNNKTKSDDGTAGVRFVYHEYNYQ